MMAIKKVNEQVNQKNFNQKNLKGVGMKGAKVRKQEFDGMEQK